MGRLSRGGAGTWYRASAVWIIMMRDASTATECWSRPWRSPPLVAVSSSVGTAPQGAVSMRAARGSGGHVPKPSLRPPPLPPAMQRGCRVQCACAAWAGPPPPSPSPTEGRTPAPLSTRGVLGGATRWRRGRAMPRGGEGLVWGPPPLARDVCVSDARRGECSLTGETHAAAALVPCVAPRGAGRCQLRSAWP